MYKKGMEFMVVGRVDATRVAPNLVYLVDAKLRDDEKPAYFAIVFEAKEGREVDSPKGAGEYLLDEGEIDVAWFGPCLSPLQWMILEEEETLGDWMTQHMLPVFDNTKGGTALRKWVADNGRRYVVCVKVSGLPYTADLTGLVVAESKAKATEMFCALCVGIPVVWSAEDDTDSVTEAGWLGKLGG